MRENSFFNSGVEGDLDVFKKNVDIIIANCMVSDLKDVQEKVFTRDLSGAD